MQATTGDLEGVGPRQVNETGRVSESQKEVSFPILNWS